MSSIVTDFTNNWQRLLDGLLVSIELTVLTLIIGLFVGLVLALGQMSRNSTVRISTTILVEAGRGAPALVMLLIIYNGLPKIGLTFDVFFTAVVALSITTAAYTSEIMRGGFQAVPAGEVEAGEALGMKRLDVLRHVVVPQGIRVAIPALMGFAIIIFQATSLTYYVGGGELMKVVSVQAANTFHQFNFYVIAAVLYACITIPASFLTERFEKRLARHL